MFLKLRAACLVLALLPFATLGMSVAPRDFRSVVRRVREGFPEDAMNVVVDSEGVTTVVRRVREGFPEGAMNVVVDSEGVTTQEGFKGEAAKPEDDLSPHQAVGTRPHEPVLNLNDMDFDRYEVHQFIEAPAFRTALIMQGERRDGHLQYMYEPPLTSLRRGFEHSGNWRVIAPTPISANPVETVRAHMAQLKPGDIFIWLGEAKRESRNWRRDARDIAGSSESLGEDPISQFMKDRSLLDFGSLRNRGIKLVYYQSEPAHDCRASKRDVDEIWDFSWHNIDMCNLNPNAPLQRYVPLAALPTPTTKQNEDPGALLFFGAVGYRHCWKNITEVMGNQLVWEYGAWSDEAYQDVLRKHNIFLNLHKGCGATDDQHNPVTWRNAKLLNAGGIIISQRAYPKDEQEFAGLIDFVELKDIPRKYKELAGMNKTARQELVDLRMAQFRQRFHPRRIFQAAGIM